MKQTYNLSPDFISSVLQCCGGYMRPEELDRFFDKLSAEAAKFAFSRSAENNLLRIIQSSFDRTLLIGESVKYPLFMDILLSASVNSNYICDILVRDPEFFYWAANPSVLNTRITCEYSGSAVSAITRRYNTFISKINALKSFKRKEILRIALQDLLGIFPMDVITSELSALAASILDNLFTLCYTETERKYKLSLNIHYAIVSLGKLGGNELNYSSDTDLIIFFDKEKKNSNRYNSEYLTEIIKLFIESSSRSTDNGYLYRIDFRLRPDGRNSALCRTLNEYLDYYETRGDQWERQMLIKAGFISGDTTLYKKFISYITPFIYPASHLISPAQEVSRLKYSIEKNLKEDLNIKLTKGGIRDIEFAVQVLQLLNGGRHKILRSGNTLETLKELLNLKIITKTEEQILRSAYYLYRKTEHYLQLMNDRQVHTIPERGEIVERMAAFLGYKDSKALHHDLQEKRNAVRKIYLSVIPGGEETTGMNMFSNKPQTERALSFMREGKDLSGEKIYDQKTQNAYLEFEPVMYRLLSEMPDPDQLIQNLTSVIMSSSFPSIWFEELKDETFCRYSFKICTYSRRAVSLLSSSPELQDFVLTRKVFADYKADEINSFSLNKMLLYLYVQISLSKIEPQTVSEILSQYCSEKTRKSAENILGSKGYFVAGMGSFGSGEMIFSSDIDLVFTVRKGSAEYQKKFLQLLNKLNDELKVFKPDCRLRPEGKSSQLSWELASYFKYLDTRARIWELQSLCRIRFVAGDEKMFASFVGKVKERISRENCSKVKSEILEMRKKQLSGGISGLSRNIDIKKNRGGLTDVEFIAQYLILCTPELYNRCRGNNIHSIIEQIISFSDNYADLALISASSVFLKKIELFSQSAFDSDKTYFPGEENKKKLIAAYLNCTPEELEKKFKDALHLNSSIFDKYFT